MHRFDTTQRFALLAVGLTTALAAGTLISAPARGAAPAAHAHAHAPADIQAVPAVQGKELDDGVPGISGVSSPLSIEGCEDRFNVSCYSPGQLREAYRLNSLYRAGITGKKQTVVVVESYGSPTIQHDVDVYSRQFGMKSTHIDVMRWGRVPRFDPADPTRLAWATETSLDVEMTHAVAPDARIVLVETGVAESTGTTGLPEMMNAEKYLIDHHVGDVINQSFGAAENTFPGFDVGDFSGIENLRYAFKDAKKHHVTVLASSGDFGPTNVDANGTVFPHEAHPWPATDPLVASIGGTQLHLDDKGERTAPDSVWNDSDISSGAGGGGSSSVFTRPQYQNGVRKVVGAHRGTPDVSMSAAFTAGPWIATSFANNHTEWNILGGTSQASPLFSGVVALADQVAGHRLGDIHKALYKLSEKSRGTSHTGILDVNDHTNNSYGGVTGFTAGKGYDMATGVGTIDAAHFVPELAGQQ